MKLIRDGIVDSKTQRVLEVIMKSYATHVRYPDDVINSIGSPENHGNFTPEKRFVDGLSGGLIPVILFMDQLSLIYPDQGYDELVHDHLSRAVHDLMDPTLPHTNQVGLFTGLTGFCYAVNICSRSGQKYQQLLEQLDTYYLQVLSKLMNQSETLVNRRWNHFDVIAGSSGVARYLLRRLDDDRFGRVLDILLDQLIRRSRNINSPDGFYVNAEDLPSQMNRNDYPNGYVDYGMAHGLSGILSVLSIAALASYEREGIYDAICAIAETLMKGRFTERTVHLWPHGSGQTSNPSSQPSPFSWCYGTAGTSVAMLLAGQATDATKYITFADNSLESVFYHEGWPYQAALNPCICHGLAGFLQIMVRYSGLRRTTIFDTSIDEAARGLAKSWNYEGIPGFLLAPNGDSIPQTSLLEGSVGCTLALTSLAIGSTSEWDEFLLIS